MKELKFGQMALDMRVFGGKTKLMAKENSGMLTGTSLRESGKMIKLMGMAYTLI